MEIAYRADVAEMRDCLEILRKAGLNVVTIVDGDRPVAYLVPLPLIQQDIADSGYGIKVLNLRDGFNWEPNED